MHGSASTTNTLKITVFTPVIYGRLASNSLFTEEMESGCFMAFLEHRNIIVIFVHFLWNLSDFERQRLTTRISASDILLILESAQSPV